MQSIWIMYNAAISFSNFFKYMKFINFKFSLFFQILNFFNNFAIHIFKVSFLFHIIIKLYF